MHRTMTRAAALLLAAAVSAGFAEELPAPLTALQSRGVEIHRTFEAPGGLTGYTATVDGHPLAIYLLPDGEHVIVGTLLDADGDDMTYDQLAELRMGVGGDELWRMLEATHWIADGAADAPRIVYTFTDPHCPYCRRFWEEARPWVDAGLVQLRHVMVGIIRDDSAAHATALLNAHDSQRELDLHMRHGRDLGEAPRTPASELRRVAENNLTFRELGFAATPTTLYRDGERVIPIEGQPQGEVLESVMGGPAP